jgi:hypothetical protein
VADFVYLGADHLVSSSPNVNMYHTLSPEQKIKFQFPRNDSDEINLYMDNRTDHEKMCSVLRSWHQILSPAQLQIWNSIATRDLSSKLNLTSGIPATKSMIEREIKRFKLSAAEKLRLQKQLPAEFSFPDPLSKLSETGETDRDVLQPGLEAEHLAGPMQELDILQVSTFSDRLEQSRDLKTLQEMIAQIRDKTSMKLFSIFRLHPDIFLSCLHILKSKVHNFKLFNSLYEKLNKNIECTIKTRMLKKTLPFIGKT